MRCGIRDIKNTHRAKLKNRKNIWVEGFYCNKDETTYCFKEDYDRNPVKKLHFIVVDATTDWGLPNEFRFYEIDKGTLSRNTGLSDGKEFLWEGDIFRCDDEHYRVEWDDYEMAWKAVSVYGEDSISLGEFRYEEIIVIGNIWDDPELGWCSDGN